MSRFNSSLRECFGFSQIMASQFFQTSMALELMSPKFPIGVDTMYKPFFIIFFLFFIILLASCAPVNNNLVANKNELQNELLSESLQDKEQTNLTKKNNKKKIDSKIKTKIQNNITIIFSNKDDPGIVSQFLNIIELAVYKKKLKNIHFDVKMYDNANQLIGILDESSLLGKIFIGPINTKDTELLEQYCKKGAIFFSFSSSKKLANDCVYLVNFFPDNEMRTIFNYFPDNSRIVLLYPENSYGYRINMVIDSIANKSNSVIVNRASYNESLSNAPNAIKELGKYELRKYELNRQKKILASKKDNESKKRLIRLEKFQTTQDLDFTHVIIADYGLRLLQVAPLLPYYDIDPNIVRFVGTGAWDDEVFYDEPSLSGAIYPGIEFIKREELVKDYHELYDEKLLRISTLPFALVGLLDFIINKTKNLESLHELLNDKNLRFSGVDGNFYFLNNSIERDLSILKINKGEVKLISK